LPVFVVRAFQFVMRGACAIAFQAIYVYTPEVYPTSIRALGMGLASAVGRLGGIVTPFVAVTVLNEPRLGPAMALTVYGMVRGYWNATD
jgi:nitrate/nitrite transporter NarK